MKIRRLLRLALIGFLIVAAFVVLLVGTGWAYAHPGMVRTSGVVYGRRLERDLTYDVVKPTSPNGLGVVLVVSGGWKSGTNSFQPWMASPLIRRGYTIFPVFHVSQPQATVAEIFDDVSRAVRHIRAHAREYGIDPARLGVVGGSAGGHLSLMLATRGGPGPADAVDPVDRESSAVQAVAIFYPVTDLLNLGDSTENLHDGGPPKSFVKAFRPDPARPQAWPEIGRALSPIYFVSSNTPPTLIFHGDADTLVPLDQARRYQVRAAEFGRTVELVVHPGGSHGWPTMFWDIRAFADWFDRYLRP